MKSPKTVILALGSNLDDRLSYLQMALEKIHQNIGWVLQVSKIYETPAWGFDGNAFYNACVSVSTRLEAEEILSEIQKIEGTLGRERSNSGNYKDRTIDLDILLFEDEILESASLKIPHPGIPDRSFVLKPLNDIAGSAKHPVLKKKFGQLLLETSDTSEISIAEDILKKPEMNFNFPACNYIAVEGNIGAGKTSFSTMVSEDFNAKLILERFKDNPFLPKFYEDKDRYAFSLEMSFLADRYQQLSDDLAQYDLFKDFVISDYDVFKSLIFAKITLHEDEYSLYHKLFHLMYKELVKPELYIYLYQNTDRLLENIKKRGRDYEQNIQPEYLIDINKSYLNFIKSQSNMKVQVIDISGLDFVSNRKDYLWLLAEIDKAVK